MSLRSIPSAKVRRPVNSGCAADLKHSSAWGHAFSDQRSKCRCAWDCTILFWAQGLQVPRNGPDDRVGRAQRKTATSMGRAFQSVQTGMRFLAPTTDTLSG